MQGREMQDINKFIADCRKRINQEIFLSALSTFMLTCAVLLCVLSLTYILRGYAVNPMTLLYPLPLAIIAILMRYSREKKCDAKASLFADEFFKLNNALTSARNFSQSSKEDPFHQIHFRRTSDQCRALSITEIPVEVPWKKIIATTLYVALCVIFMTYDDSPEVAFKKARDQKVLAISTQINKELNKKIDDLDESLNAEEKEEFKKSDIAKKVKELEAGKDKLEQLKKLSALEKSLKDFQNSLNNADDKRLMDKLSDKLSKSLKNKELAKNLEQGQYGKAAKGLEKLEMKDSDSLKALNQKSQNIKELSKAMQKALKDLKLNKSKLAQAMKDFSDKNLKLSDKMCQMCENPDKGDQDAKNMVLSQMNQSMSNMKSMLMQMQMKSDLNSKMDSLNSSLMQMQSSLAKEDMPPMGNKGAGSESPELKLENRGTLKGLDFNSLRAKGQVGEKGETQFSKEEAQSGSAQSGVTAKQINQENLKRQVESFIKRADIPPDVHNIVKEYFNSLHKAEGQHD